MNIWYYLTIKDSSLYTYCFKCGMFGIDFPHDPSIGSRCGNCLSLLTFRHPFLYYFYLIHLYFYKRKRHED